jgi:hypothetical protein
MKKFLAAIGLVVVILASLGALGIGEFHVSYGFKKPACLPDPGIHKAEA